MFETAGWSNRRTLSFLRRNETVMHIYLCRDNIGIYQITKNCTLQETLKILETEEKKIAKCSEIRMKTKLKHVV